jgi:hypothetical protein
MYSDAVRVSPRIRDAFWPLGVLAVYKVKMGAIACLVVLNL